MTRLAAFGLILLSLVSAPAAQQAAAPARPADESWPPAGAFRPGNGVVLPKPLSQVRPQYTGAAMREKIQGKVALECIVEPDGSVRRVRVLRSLDAVYGLDEQAVTAAKQWRFAPGTKDNVAVPVMITIELTFTLRSAPPPPTITWPEPFTSADDAAIDTSAWTESVSDAADLQIRVAFPGNWQIRKEDPGKRAIFLQSVDSVAIRVLTIENPRPARFQVGQGMTTEMFQRLAEAAAQGMASRGGKAQVLGVGQARTADHLWIWHDLSFRALDVSNMPPALGQLSDALFDGARLWTFITTAGSQEISVACGVLYRRAASDADRQHELEQGGAELAAMVKRISITVR